MKYSLRASLVPIALTLSLTAACNLMPQGGGNGGGGGGSSKPAPVPANAPGWVTDPYSYPGYPRERFMLGTGFAEIEESLGQAREKAMGEGLNAISSELNVSIEGVTETYMQQLAINDQVESVNEYIQNIKAKTKSTLFGGRQVTDFVDRGANSVYVLVALDREQHATALLKKVRTELAKAAGEADQATRTGKLQALLKEHVILEEIMPSLITLDVAVPNSLAIRAEFETEYQRAKERMRAIISELTDMEVAVRAVSGGGQKGYSKESLAQPIVFEATAGGKPLVGFPVLFELEYPEHAEVAAASTTTDAQGRFACQVVGLRLTGDQENEVFAGLNYQKFGEKVFRAPYTSQLYLLPTLETASFAIEIEETNLDAVQPESGVAGALGESLTQRKARLTSLDTVLSGKDAKAAATAETSWLSDKLGGKIDFLIRGTARSRASVKNSMGIAFSYAGGSIELIDVRTGVRLAHMEVPLSSNAIKSSGSNHEDAGTKALKMFGAKVAAEFTAKIEEVFEIPAEQ